MKKKDIDALVSIAYEGIERILGEVPPADEIHDYELFRLNLSRKQYRKIIKRGGILLVRFEVRLP